MDPGTWETDVGSLSQSSSVVKDDGTSVKTMDSKTAKEDGSKVHDPR